MKTPRTVPSWRPSPSMVVAVIALFVALGGSAVAVTQIDGSHLKNRSVAGKKLKKHTLTGKEIKDAFQHFCQPGAVAAYVYVKGNVTFSSTYTSSTDALPNQFNCTGGGVQVKRVSTGLYDVRFHGLNNKNLLVAASNQTVTPAGVAVNGGSNTYKLVADATISNEQVWEVRVFNGVSAPVDNEFSFALLSPTPS